MRGSGIAALAAVLVIGGCTTSVVSGVGTRSSSGASTSSQPTAPKQQYYLSLGDSYPAGYQPGHGTTRSGFPYQVVADARAKGYDFALVNLACGGATTSSVLHSPGCASHVLGPGAASYAPRTQTEAAVRFLQQHRGSVGLITISLGGNDFLDCGLRTDLLSCVTAAVRTIGANLTMLLTRLRSATGPDTRIVGTTYPDIFLGELLSHDSAVRALARLSVSAFQSLLNPELARVYAAAGAEFVDVTKASGGYGPLTQLTTLAPYGRIPVPVADICKLTWFCQLHDVHPRPAGHALIARLVVATLPRQ